jgi:hypothetical protein
VTAHGIRGCIRRWPWPTFAAKDPLPPGKTTLVVDFAYGGGGLGKGGVITMSANGKKIAEGWLARTIPIAADKGLGRAGARVITRCRRPRQRPNTRGWSGL